jgi:site-specific DNA recombinase
VEAVAAGLLQLRHCDQSLFDGERVRDKIAASKRKGLWVGGPVPLGYRSIAKKLIVVEEEAEQVRTIFRRYLALGSIGLLIEDLHRCGVRPRPRVGRDGGTINPTRFMVGPLAYLLKNRFYIGEVVYRGEVHPGEQQPIVEKELFEAVQAKLKHRAVARKVKQSRSPSFLSGLLFDDRGNLMSPSQANKKGVRYRYYVSQAVLQNRKDEAGSIARVAASDIEELVIDALRHQIEDIDRQAVPDQTSPLRELSDRDFVALHVERIVVRSRHIDITLQSPASPHGQAAVDAGSLASTTLHLPWTPTSASARKGIAWQPSAQSNLDPATSDLLLTAIARARSWMNDLGEGRINSFEEIARSENKVVRHIRHLAPLAFVSPRIVEAIANGSAPADITVSSLARALPHGWAAQEHKVGIT